MERLQQRLEELGCNALVVLAESARDPDLMPFVGQAHLRRAMVIVPRGGAPRLAFFSPMERDEAASCGLELLGPRQLDLERWSRETTEPSAFLAAVLGQAFLHSGVAPGRVALAGHPAGGELVGACQQLATDGWTMVPGHGLTQGLRRSKSTAQVAEIRRVAAGTCAAFRRVAACLAGCEVGEEGELLLDGEPLRVGRLRAEVAQELAQSGLEQPEGNIIAPAEEGAVPHNAGTDSRPLRAGETLIVDLFPRGHLFADCTRTFCVGEPPSAVCRAHRMVKRALQRAYRASGPGVRGWDLQQATCQLFAEFGYPTVVSDPHTECGYVHGLGHGVGFEVHELPSFRRQADDVEGRLALGDVFTLEPGLYDPTAGFGVRLEDTVLLTADGPENLTPLPYDLDPHAWE